MKLGDTFKTIGKQLSSAENVQYMRDTILTVYGLTGEQAPSAYTGTTTDIAFQIIREFIGAFGTVVGIIEVVAPGTVPTAIGITCDLSDVLGQYLYTIYGE